jgi:hypothetical protein
VYFTLIFACMQVQASVARIIQFDDADGSSQGSAKVCHQNGRLRFSDFDCRLQNTSCKLTDCLTFVMADANTVMQNLI